MAGWIPITEDVIVVPTDGVLVKPAAFDRSPWDFYALIKQAMEVYQDPILREVVGGNDVPYCSSYDEFLDWREGRRVGAATAKAKTRLVRRRRRQFEAARRDLALALIDRGVPHICAYEGCSETENLTLDHIVPLSRGGSDDLDNLQFLCGRHNSAKGDRASKLAG